MNQIFQSETISRFWPLNHGASWTNICNNPHRSGVLDSHITLRFKKRRKRCMSCSTRPSLSGSRNVQYRSSIAQPSLLGWFGQASFASWDGRHPLVLFVFYRKKIHDPTCGQSINVLLLYIQFYIYICIYRYGFGVCIYTYTYLYMYICIWRCVHVNPSLNP